MAAKRPSFAESLCKEAAAGKVQRTAAAAPLVACVRPWGSAFWVFPGGLARANAL